MKKQNFEIKQKIIIDLDVVTVALWNKKGNQLNIADKFIGRVKQKEFNIINPFFLIELVLKWKYEELRENIKEFYLNYSDKILSDTDISEQAAKKILDPNDIIPHIIKIGIKDEDALLVFVSSLFELDYLVTFNRKHLRNNVKKINEVLKRFGLNEIKIVLPDEI